MCKCDCYLLVPTPKLLAKTSDITLALWSVDTKVILVGKFSIPLSLSKYYQLLPAASLILKLAIILFLRYITKVYIECKTLSSYAASKYLFLVLNIHLMTINKGKSHTICTCYRLPFGLSQDQDYVISTWFHVSNSSTGVVLVVKYIFMNFLCKEIFNWSSTLIQKFLLRFYRFYQKPIPQLLALFGLIRIWYSL